MEDNSNVEKEEEEEKETLVPFIAQKKNDPQCLALEITEKFKLVRFEIDAIRIVPHKSASVDITIFGDNEKLYCRTFFLSGQAYLNYETDDYLFEWVRNNIETIFTI
jgi:hypothetical protein